ncbi:chaperone protein dnaJ 20, chloroplastic-like [Bidens hawaiensis]|uniref:chaperone protein dnaJ 20, chloroplastic-like n=1 Tax=Bidens hawaiensis TaxID=980011 RepID=UPI00404B1CD0
MCCSHGFISRLPTTPPPLVTPRTHLPISPTIRILPQTTTAGSRSYRTQSVKDSGASVSETIKDELSFYELLGLSETVTYVEIKQAYKQLARKYHPDVSPPGRVDEYTQKFIRVQEAYETLSDPDRRAVYDRDMAMGIHFAFSSRNQLRNQEKMEKCEWRGQWQSQLSELRKRSTNKETGSNMSWAARMRRERSQSSS